MIFSILLMMLSLRLDAHALDYKALGLEKMSEPAADFEIQDLQKKISHLSDQKGHPVILHFWASWCTPCQKELPELRDFAAGIKGTPFVFLPVAIDGIEKTKDVENILHTMKPGIDFKALVASKPAHKYYSWGVPITYFISAKGEIRGRAMGSKSWTHFTNAQADMLVKDLE